jgi:hypothetical protein
MVEDEVIVCKNSERDVPVEKEIEERMKSKPAFYKKYVDKSIRIQRGIFIVVGLIMFIFVMYDSVVNNLPFYYVVFFIIGILISISFIKIKKLTWNEHEQKIELRRMSIFGFILIIFIVILRIFILPDVFLQLSIIHITDAVLLISMGIFAGRIHFIGGQIEELTFERYMKKNKKE